MEQEAKRRTRRWSRRAAAAEDGGGDLRRLLGGGDHFSSASCGCSCEPRVQGIDVQGMERVRELAQSHVMIYLPSHRSHADYLLVRSCCTTPAWCRRTSPPARNLNMPVVGMLLRRCGAFSCAASSRRPPVLRAVPRLHGLADPARLVLEFFPEAAARAPAPADAEDRADAMMVESALRSVRKVM